MANPTPDQKESASSLAMALAMCITELRERMPQDACDWAEKVVALNAHLPDTDTLTFVRYAIHKNPIEI